MLGRGKSAKDESFSTYVEASRSRLFRMAYLMCGDAHRAEDLVQSALAKAYVSWTRVQRNGDPHAYVRRIMVNANIDDYRKTRRRELLGLADRDLPIPPGVAPEDVDALVVALRALPVGQRTVVVLRHYLGLSVDETARDLGLSTGTVKSQTAAALAGLRDSLGVSV
jgi:RNA polymerase sigma-70 factor (sigma-E family)